MATQAPNTKYWSKVKNIGISGFMISLSFFRIFRNTCPALVGCHCQSPQNKLWVVFLLALSLSFVVADRGHHAKATKITNILLCLIWGRYPISLRLPSRPPNKIIRISNRVPYSFPRPIRSMISGIRYVCRILCVSHWQKFEVYAF